MNRPHPLVSPALRLRALIRSHALAAPPRHGAAARRAVERSARAFSSMGGAVPPPHGAAADPIFTRSLLTVHAQSDAVASAAARQLSVKAGPADTDAGVDADATVRAADAPDRAADAPPPQVYDWVDQEARELIIKAYARHKALADKSQSFPPSLSVTDLEQIGEPFHYTPKDMVDRTALGLMKFLRVFVHAFFREKYDHHAVCLETVAAVPGLVASFHRHLRSLRRMRRDHGWINVMQEEAENERMHLLIFMQVCQPTAVERTLVVVAQCIYLGFYSTLYLLNSRAAHRLTGYLEEEAHRAYTDYLRSIDEGKLRNKPAPVIAKNYYHLPEDATMRDVVLHVRADEAMHRDLNHHLGEKYHSRDIDTPPHPEH